MKYDTENKFMLFLEKWFKDQTNYKKFFNFSDEILNNIDYYDFTDIIKMFTHSIIPKTKYNTSIDCSDSDMNSWDETQGEYYNYLPIKYNIYNKRIKKFYSRKKSFSSFLKFFFFSIQNLTKKKIVAMKITIPMSVINFYLKKN